MHACVRCRFSRPESFACSLRPHAQRTQHAQLARPVLLVVRASPISAALVNRHPLSSSFSFLHPFLTVSCFDCGHSPRPRRRPLAPSALGQSDRSTRQRRRRLDHRHVTPLLALWLGQAARREAQCTASAEVISRGTTWAVSRCLPSSPLSSSTSHCSSPACCPSFTLVDPHRCQC